MRIAIPVLILCVLLAFWYLQSAPEEAGPAVMPKRVASAGTSDLPVKRRISSDRVLPKPETEAQPVTPQEKPPVPVAPQATVKTKTHKGPFTIDLGEHTVHLRDDARKRVAQFRLQLVTQTEATRVEIRRRRRELLRMTCFLGSRRQADGAAGPTGKARFEHDLLERFQNVVRSGGIDSLKLLDYRLVSRAQDAGTDD